MSYASFIFLSSWQSEIFMTPLFVYSPVDWQLNACWTWDTFDSCSLCSQHMCSEQKAQQFTKQLSMSFDVCWTRARTITIHNRVWGMVCTLTIWTITVLSGFVRSTLCGGCINTLQFRPTTGNNNSLVQLAWPGVYYQPQHLWHWGDPCTLHCWLECRMQLQTASNIILVPRSRMSRICFYLSG